MVSNYYVDHIKWAVCSSLEAAICGEPSTAIGALGCGGGVLLGHHTVDIKG